VAIPILDPKGQLKNIRLYKPRPKEGEAKILSWGRGFGSARLFPAVPPAHSDGPVLLCEGESDTLCALSHGFNAITQTSKTKAWKARDLQWFAGKDVVVAYDADRAGVKYGQWAAAALSPVAACVRLLVWPDWMGRLEDGSWPEKHGQDLTDFFVRHGRTARELAELVASARVWEGGGLAAKKKIPSDPPGPPRKTSGFAGTQDSKGGTDGDAVEVGEEFPHPSVFFDVSPGGRVSFKPHLLADELRRRTPVLSDPATRLLYRWNGKFWEEYQEDQVRTMALRLLQDEGKRAWAEDAVYQVRHGASLPEGRAVNDRDGWLCVQNGMLRLSDLKLVDHDPDYFCTYALDVEFDPERGRPLELERYLSQTAQTPGPIRLLQEFTGSLFMRDTRFAKCLLLLGPGADGKSVFLKTLRHLVGPANACAVSFKDLEDKFARVALYNKMLNIGTEISDDLVESAAFKAIVTGDPVSARYLFGNLFEFVPYVKLAFAANRFPRLRDHSDGLFRRLLMVQFKRQFLYDADPYLEDKLLKELPSIFLWALAGYRRLLDHGWTECAETRELLLQHRKMSNSILAFVDEQCDCGEHFSVNKDELYKKYKEWSYANGFGQMNVARFFTELYAAKGQLSQARPRDGGKRVYVVHGIGLRDVA